LIVRSFCLRLAVLLGFGTPCVAASAAIWLNRVSAHATGENQIARSQESSGTSLDPPANDFSNWALVGGSALFGFAFLTRRLWPVVILASKSAWSELCAPRRCAFGRRAFPAEIRRATALVCDLGCNDSVSFDAALFSGPGFREPNSTKESPQQPTTIFLFVNADQYDRLFVAPASRAPQVHHANAPLYSS